MGKYILKRVLQFIPVFLGVTLILFALQNIVPGDPIKLIGGEKALTPEVELQLRVKYHLVQVDDEGNAILDENGDVIEAEWSEVKKAIDFGAALGAKHYLCSVAYVPQLSYYKNITAAIKVLNRIVSYAKENGMKCGIVNCMMGGNYIRTPEQWKLVLDEVPGLGIKYDPSHSFVHGGDKGAYLKEGMEWGDKFVYCHVKGVIQYGDSHEPSEWKNRELMVRHPELKDELMGDFAADRRYYDNPPAGIDSINWRAFFAVLYQHDYDGYLAIEPHSMTWQGEKGEKGVKYTIKYIRDLML